MGSDFILETRHLQLQASVSNLQEDFSLDSKLLNKIVNKYLIDS